MIPLPNMDRYGIADVIAEGGKFDDDTIVDLVREWLAVAEGTPLAPFFSGLLNPREITALADLAYRRRSAPVGLRVDLVALDDEELIPTLLRREDGVHLFYPSQVHTVYGQKSSAKSLVVMAEAVRLLQAGQSVIYINYEGQPAQVKARLRRLGASTEDLAHFHYVRGFGAHLTPAQRREWDAYLSMDFALAIIDTTNAGMAAFDLDPIKTGDVRKFYGLLAEPLAATPGAPAVVMVDHVTKTRPQRGAATAYGSEAKTSALDAAYLFEVIEKPGVGRIGIVDMICVKDRHDYVFANTPDAQAADDNSFPAARITIDGTGPTTEIRIGLPEVKPPKSVATETVNDMARIRDAVLRAHREQPGIRQEDLVSRIKAYDKRYTADQIKQARNELVDLGALVKAPEAVRNEKRYVLNEPDSVPPGSVTETELIGSRLDHRLPNAHANDAGVVPLETQLQLTRGGY
ncbi:AAA family ATPase [Micromonospora sp. NPDC005215]|uniref:AAA family ATPase n=1 Tax=Micromonospora sp. NPDC005215 TaxID=3157024 RepID=UPI0033BD67EA